MRSSYTGTKVHETTGAVLPHNYAVLTDLRLRGMYEAHQEKKAYKLERVCTEKKENQTAAAAVVNQTRREDGNMI